MNENALEKMPSNQAAVEHESWQRYKSAPTPIGNALVT